MYYLFFDGRQAGPFDIGYLRKGWREGTLTKRTLYWQEGMPEWKPLGDIESQMEETLPAATSPSAPAPVAGDPMIIGGFWRRLTAFLVDVLLLALVGFGSGYFLFLFYTELGQSGLLIGLVIATAYFGLLNSRLGGGRTLGKRLLGLRVVDANGNLLSPGLSISRYLILAFPFFFNKALNNGLVTNLTIESVLFIPVMAGFLAFTYLLIFNRHTRQLVHDLIVRTYVVRKISPQPAQAPTTWRGHLIVVGALCAVVVLLACLSPLLLQFSIFKETVAVRQAVIDTGYVQTAAVTGGTTFVTSSTSGLSSTRVLTILAHLKGIPKHSDAFADKFANLAIQANPDIAKFDRIDVSISYGYDIGIASGVVTDQFHHTPDEWSAITPGHDDTSAH